MLRTSLWPLQQAIYNRLNQDSLLKQRISGVFDKVPKGKPFPYVHIGAPVVTPFETKTTFGENIPWVLHVYSDYDGKKEASELLNLMMQALTKEPWVVEGFKVFKFNIEPNTQVLDPAQAGMPYQGILRIRFHINN
ncbi:DUF3168 domain-containing protein [Peribacillus simplex]|uniref:DUF3168 domain-containing protein n=1 Tax=Peribacillus simplex TaxID=1478 RepID=A0A9W4KTL3_9BACI|nr:DUF3168 domain-containing protein [Peribacillus simplex]CAH0185967.1 hypothetical protein SRABI133_01544 [Peribacillus simplex]